MEEIILLNERQKIALSGGGGGGGGSLGGSGTQVPSVSEASIQCNSGDSYARSSSPSYMRAFYHGSGQYSVTSVHYHNSYNQAEHYARPFKVDQTTGAITVGSGTQVFSGSSNIDTGDWASGGNIVVRHGTSGSYGNFSSAYRVNPTNNTIAATNYSQYSSAQPVSNGSAATYWESSTNRLYFAPSVYSTSTGTAHKFVRYVDTNLNWSNQYFDNLGSDTSTTYVFPVVPQYGNESSVYGMGLQFYRNGSNYYWALLNNFGNTTSTYNNFNNGFRVRQAIPSGFGFELSNARQVFYNGYNEMYVRTSSTALTQNMTQPDRPPVNIGNETPTTITPVAPDTWIAYADNNPTEIVKFSINPTTYDITILETVPLSSLVGNFTWQFGGGYRHVSITGTNNQFLTVVLSIAGRGGGFYAGVFENPFTI